MDCEFDQAPELKSLLVLAPCFCAFLANLRSLNILIPGGILQAVLCFGDQGGLPDHAPRLHQRTEHLPVAIAFDAVVSCTRSMTMLFLYAGSSVAQC